MKLIKFYSDTCGPCKMQAEWFRDFAFGIEYEEINIKDDTDLIEKFKIRKLPTVILTDNDELVHSWIGATRPEPIKAYIDGLREGQIEED